MRGRRLYQSRPLLQHKPEAELEARLDEVKPRHSVVPDELEGVVQMLQGGPSFPPSAHLVVAGEIPDED